LQKQFVIKHHITVNVMRETVAIITSFQRAGGWCEPVTIRLQRSLLNSNAELSKVSRAGLGSLTGVQPLPC